jgi:hypothetical protein
VPRSKARIEQENREPRPQYRTVNWLKMADARAWHRRQPKTLAGVEHAIGADKV